MTNAQDFTRFFAQLPGGFPVDQGTATDAWKTWATFGERFSGIALEAAAKSNEVAAGSAQETLARLGEVTKVRDEPSDYAQVVVDFAQAQADLSRRTAEAFAGIVQRAQTDTTELFTTTGERIAQTGAASTGTAANKAVAKTKRAAKAA